MKEITGIREKERERESKANEDKKEDSEWKRAKFSAFAIYAKSS